MGGRKRADRSDGSPNGDDPGDPSEGPAGEECEAPGSRESDSPPPELVREGLADPPTSEALREFDRLIEQYGELIRRRVGSLIRSPDRCGDLLQETHLAIFVALKRRQVPPNPKSWIRRVVAHRAARLVTAHEREDVARIAIETELERTAPDAEEPLIVAERNEAVTRTMEAVARLPEAERSLVEMKFRGMTAERIAEETGSSLRTVWRIQHDAFERLRPFLIGLDGDDP